MTRRLWPYSLIPAALYQSLPRAAAATTVELNLNTPLALLLWALAGILVAASVVWAWAHWNARRVVQVAATEPLPLSEGHRRSRALGERLERARATRAESADKVERVLARWPSASADEVARRANVSLDLARFHLARLQRLGAIRE